MEAEIITALGEIASVIGWLAIIISINGLAIVISIVRRR